MAFQERYGEIRRRIVQIILAVLLAPLLVFSISPASADLLYESLSLDGATDLVESGETATAGIFATFYATSPNDTMSVTVVPISYPTGHAKTAKLSFSSASSANVTQGSNSYTVDMVRASPWQVASVNLVADVTQLDFAGTYVFAIVSSKNGTALKTKTWTITVREPNFKIHLTNSASTTGNNVQFVLTNPKDFPDNAWAVKNFTLDSSDNLESYIQDGTYQVQVSPNTDEATTRVLSTAYTFVINGGVVASFPTSTAPVSGVYQLALGTTGLNVTSTIGGVKKSFNPIRISAANGVTKTINPAYLSDKSVSLAIDAGTYKIRVEGTDSKFNGLSGDCVVTTGSITACDVAMDANNFPFQVVGSSGETLTALVSSTLLGVSIYRTIDGKYLDYESVFQGTDSETVSLQNGTYKVNIHKNMKAYWTYRSDASYSMTITGGVVTALTSITTGESVSLSGPRYLLPIPGDNFKIRAMGGSTPSTSGRVCFYNRTGGSNACMSRDSSGELSTRLFNGTTDIDVYSNSTDFVTARYTATVASGVVTSIANSLGETITAQSGIYVLPLKVANVQGTLTIGGVAKYGYISQVIDKTSGNSCLIILLLLKKLIRLDNY
jgi:flagellar hook assembly protein FlgD